MINVWLNTTKVKIGFDLVFGIIVIFLNPLTHSVLVLLAGHVHNHKMC